MSKLNLHEIDEILQNHHKEIDNLAGDSIQLDDTEVESAAGGTTSEAEAIKRRIFRNTQF